MVSESSYTKYVVIMIIIYNFIKPNYKITRKTEGQLTLYVINEYVWQSNEFNDTMVGNNFFL